MIVRRLVPLAAAAVLLTACGGASAIDTKDPIKSFEGLVSAIAAGNYEAACDGVGVVTDNRSMASAVASSDPALLEECKTQTKPMRDHWEAEGLVETAKDLGLLEVSTPGTGDTYVTVSWDPESAFVGEACGRYVDMRMIGDGYYTQLRCLPGFPG